MTNSVTNTFARYTDEPITVTQPTCPLWCERGAEHTQEARDRIGSWFHHSVTLRDDDVAHVSLSLIQYFAEQGRTDVDEAITVGIDVHKENLTQTQALELAAAVVTAASFAATEGSWAPGLTAGSAAARFARG